MEDDWKKGLVKLTTVFVVVFSMVFHSIADPVSVQELWSRLFIRTEIVWQKPTNDLPKDFWIYRRMVPRVFSETIISNAIVMGSIRVKDFPKPSAKDFSIFEDKGPGYMGSSPCIFGITPSEASVYYTMTNYPNGSSGGIPDDETLSRRAWQSASLLGLEPANLVQAGFYNHWCDAEENGRSVDFVCGRGVFLSRQLDGSLFFSLNGDGESAEGFSMEFGSGGQVRSFSLCWPKLERYKKRRTASQQEITRCIGAGKALVMPDLNEPDFFARLRKLAGTKMLLITKITACYSEWSFGEQPTNGGSAKFAMPMAELQATAEMDGSNSPVRLLAPITSAEVRRLLRK